MKSVSCGPFFAIAHVFNMLGLRFSSNIVGTDIGFQFDRDKIRKLKIDSNSSYKYGYEVDV